jgi:N-hydroxyarylamine O-acetyltransferase
MSELSSGPIDLDAYLRRIDYTGQRQPTAALLEKLHLAHVIHIPFENLDILLDRPIRLDLESLQAKLVRARRGGYCFEQNTLLAAALEAMGFAVTRLAARVRLGTTRVLPRTHMLLKVEAEGKGWLADVGFGGEGLLKPIPLTPGQAVQQHAWTYRVSTEGALWVLQSLHDRTWQDLYAFTLEPQFDVDYEMANHYASTYASSRFVQTLTAQRSTPDARYILRGREFSVVRGAEATCRTLADAEELFRVLAGTFGLHFPPGTRFRVMD